METFSWPFCEGTPLLTGGFPSQKGQRRGALIFYLPEQTDEQALETPVIWDAIARCNELFVLHINAKWYKVFYTVVRNILNRQMLQ